jgi:hypothetical protein
MVDRVKQMENIQKQALDLFKRKNADYGDAFATYGINFIQDKIQRSISITKNGINLVDDESLKDKLHNYSAMGLMIMD